MAKSWLLSCPSAQPDMVDARIFGVVDGSVDEPRVAYLERPVALDATARASLGDLGPTRVFRLAAQCEPHACAHFNGATCSLARRVVEHLSPVVDALPACRVRVNCRWFEEQGPAACLRCPQVVTMIPRGDTPLNHAAVPPEVV